MKNAEAMTNADRIRAMTDEELAAALLDIHDGGSCFIPFCKVLPECHEDMDQDRDIPDERCIGCMLEWPRKPVEEDRHADENL